jgi:hypothetical protein
MPSKIDMRRIIAMRFDAERLPLLLRPRPAEHPVVADDRLPVRREFHDRLVISAIFSIALNGNRVASNDGNQIFCGPVLARRAAGGDLVGGDWRFRSRRSCRRCRD